MKKETIHLIYRKDGRLIKAIIMDDPKAKSIDFFKSTLAGQSVYGFSYSMGIFALNEWPEKRRKCQRFVPLEAKTCSGFSDLFESVSHNHPTAEMISTLKEYIRVEAQMNELSMGDPKIRVQLSRAEQTETYIEVYRSMNYILGCF